MHFRSRVQILLASATWKYSKYRMRQNFFFGEASLKTKMTSEERIFLAQQTGGLGDWHGPKIRPCCVGKQGLSSKREGMVLMKSLPSLLPGRQRRGKGHFLAAGRRRGGGDHRAGSYSEKSFPFLFAQRNIPSLAHLNWLKQSFLEERARHFRVSWDNSSSVQRNLITALLKTPPLWLGKKLHCEFKVRWMQLTYLLRFPAKKNLVWRDGGKRRGPWNGNRHPNPQEKKKQKWQAENAFFL